MTNTAMDQGTRLMRTLLVAIGFIAGVTAAISVHYHIGTAARWYWSTENP